jgi:anti-sigma regulatory factor (Ser/Thr protein kinase)
MGDGETRSLVASDCRVRAHPSSVRLVRHFVRDQIAASSFSEAEADILLAVSEAANNAVLHSGTDEVIVTWRIDGRCAEILIRDRGRFRHRIPMPAMDEQGGRGIPLMMAVMDEVDISPGSDEQPGTSIRLRKCKASNGN